MFRERYPIKPSAQDYTLAAPGERAVLMIHGFTGSPFHFREYATFLNKKGLHVRVMRLPGHGSNIADLIESSYLDWREAVHNELKALAQEKSKVYLFGYSFGANLALDAAMHYPDLIAGLVITSPAIKMRKDLFLRLLARFYDRYTSITVRPCPGLRTRSREECKAMEEHGSYTTMPVKSALEFFHFIDHFTKPHLKDVTTPCLVIQSKYDPLTSVRSAQYVYKHLGSRDKKLLILNSSEHVLITSEALQKAYDAAADFLREH